MTFPHRRLVDTSTGRVVRLSRHARQRIVEMEADPCDVLRSALQPTSWYRGSDQTGRTRIQRVDGCDIAVVFAPADATIVTVLWATDEEYTRPEKQEQA